MNRELNPRQIYADLPDHPVLQQAPTGEEAGPSESAISGSHAQPSPRPRRSPAVGTIALGLAIIVVATGILLNILADFSPEPRAAGAILLATFGALLVLSSGIGLFLHRGGRRLRR